MRYLCSLAGCLFSHQPGPKSDHEADNTPVSDILTSPFIPVVEPMFPMPVFPDVKKLTTDSGVAVPKAGATPALPLLVLQTVLQLLPPPRLFFLRLAPRLASVGLIIFPLNGRDNLPSGAGRDFKNVW